MDNRFFSLLIVPDSGSDVKTGSFNFKFILVVFSALAVTFFICLFFIIGYHIKLSQEKDYKAAVIANKTLVEHIKHSNELYRGLSETIATIQQNDHYFRQFERMDVLDASAYQAGVGGHEIVDHSKFDAFGSDLRVQLSDLAYGVVTLDNKIGVLRNSLREIQQVIGKNHEMINNTPTIYPTESIRFTSPFGWRRHPVTGRRHFHKGVDFGGYRGQEIYATAEGVVVSAKWQGPLGRCVKIKHGFGYETLYGHMDKILVKKGDFVKKNDLIGLMGRSGTTTGVHVHYAILLNGKPQNPMDYFK
ncbi:MAG: M23 family metallopeptidase [Candidatus Latescibacteria bacterium]|nr:M23 family metallopeptidase [Candidatus Latescibacterota bacterium]